jgi:hypothetical protein
MEMLSRATPAKAAARPWLITAAAIVAASEL